MGTKRWDQMALIWSSTINVEEGLIRAIKFHFHEFFERNSNASYIAVVPQKTGAKELKDYRPISLIGNFYRVVSKLLANNLKIVMRGT